MSTVYLYRYREYVQLVQADKNVPNINLPMIIYDTKVYKGVTNTIDFVARNNDRKPISLVGYQLIAQVREVNSQSNAQVAPEVLLEKRLIPVDETAGKYKLELDPNEIDDWAPGYYRFNVRTTDTNGRSELLYTDINKSTWSTFQLIEGIASSLQPAVEIPSSKFTPTPIGEEYNTRWITSSLAGDAQSQRASGTHTIAIYTTGWIGKIWVQGSLTTSPPLPSEWFNIPLSPNSDHISMDASTPPGVKMVNFTMNLYWVRVMYEPSRINQGTFDKILYKN